MRYNSIVLTKPVYILGIESSCDETAAAVSCNDNILANIIAAQTVHERFGGVVPELASRAHQQHIIPVVNEALNQANIRKNDLQAVAYTNGPGLMGALLVGSSFARTMAMTLGIPSIPIDHMEGHVLAHFARKPGDQRNIPQFPFLCLTVSGGHTQIVRVDGHFTMEVLGRTLDDAAGEAFDKISKLLGLPYPGGPVLDKLAAQGDPLAFRFPHPRVPDLDFSFSGLKTAVRYFLRDGEAGSPGFGNDRLPDICASVQHTIVSILMEKLEEAVARTGIRRVALAGGVSANSALRARLTERAGWESFIPPMEYCTDNAAMVAIAGYFRYLDGHSTDPFTVPYARGRDCG